MNYLQLNVLEKCFSILLLYTIGKNSAFKMLHAFTSSLQLLEGCIISSAFDIWVMVSKDPSNITLLEWIMYSMPLQVSLISIALFNILAPDLFFLW